MKISKDLLIRADAGGALGSGHVMRMIALAQAFADRGGSATLACVNCPDAIAERVAREGIHFKQIAETHAPGSTADLEETTDLARSLGTAWVVLDGYHFSADYQRGLRNAGFKVLAVDDYGHCDVWAADAVLNQNIFAPELKYRSESEHCRFLLGTRFALLRREFRIAAESPGADEARISKSSSQRIQCLLITLGGVDADNVTGRILAALNSVGTDPLEVKLLIGAANPHGDNLKTIVSASPHSIEVLRDVLDMPSLYRWADGVISAGGSTCWEWLFYELPAAVVALAENQRPIVGALAKHRLAMDLGWHAELEPIATAKKLQDWLLGPRDHAAGSPPGHRVDGGGADRVAALLDGKIRISIATAEGGWIREACEQFAAKLREDQHEARVVIRAADIPKGDVLLLLSFWGIVPADILARNSHNLVVHASDLPKGRGWSPLTWQILDGASEIPLTLLEARAKVDSGEIYRQRTLRFAGHELLPELRAAVTEGTFALCREFIDNYPGSAAWGRVQSGDPSYYPRRGRLDSQLDPNQSISSQFNLLRTVDNENYPAFFDLHGHRYILRVEKNNRILE